MIKEIRQAIDLFFEIAWDCVQVVFGLTITLLLVACIKYIWIYITTGEIIWRIHA